MDKLPKPQHCWVDATVLVNFEATTLPLLFAGEDDYRLYYSTMKQLHPRKARALHEVQKIGEEAKKAKTNGDLVECVTLLRTAADKRHYIFLNDDFQVLAAHEHLLMSAAHLAVIAMSEDRLPQSHQLLHFAQELLREYHIAEGVMAVPFSKATRTKMSFVINSTLASYWVRRGKWNAALQASQAALNKWCSLVENSTDGSCDPSTRDPMIQHVSQLVVVRRLVAAVAVTNGSELKPLISELKSLSEATCQSEDNVDTPDDSIPSNAINFTIQLNEEESFDATICINSSNLSYNCDWGIMSATYFLATFAHAMANYKMRRFTECQESLEKCALRIKAEGEHEQWWDAVNLLSYISVEASERDLVPKYKTPTSLMKSNDVLATAQMLREHILAKKATHARTKEEQSRRRKLLAEGEDTSESDDENSQLMSLPQVGSNSDGLIDLPPESPGGGSGAMSFGAASPTSVVSEQHPLAASPRRKKYLIPPWKEEVSGLVPETADSNRVVSEWTKTIPAFESKVSPGNALKQLDARAIHSPIDVARTAVVSRQKKRIHESSSNRTIPTNDLSLPHLAQERRPASELSGKKKLNSKSKLNKSDGPRSMTPNLDLESRYKMATPGQKTRLRMIPRDSKGKPQSSAASSLAATMSGNSQVETLDDILEDAMLDLNLDEKHKSTDKLKQHIRARESFVKSLQRSIHQDKKLLHTIKHVEKVGKTKSNEYDMEFEERVKAAEAYWEEAKAERPPAVSPILPEGEDHNASVRSDSTKGSAGQGKAVDRLRKAAGMIGAVAVEEKQQQALSRRRSGFKLEVGVADEKDRERKHEHLGQFFNNTYSKTNLSLKAQTDYDTGVVHATKTNDLLPNVALLTEKQRVLRSMLPTLDHKTETYRMVVKELAENEKILSMRRTERNRENLERNAERIAKKAGIVNSWHQLVKKQASMQKKKHDDDDKSASQAASELSAMKIVSLAFMEPGAVSAQPMEPAPALPSCE